MKKKSLKSLSLNKKVISNFDTNIIGGVTIDTIKHDWCVSEKTKCIMNKFFDNAFTITFDPDDCKPQPEICK